MSQLKKVFLKLTLVKNKTNTHMISDLICNKDKLALRNALKKGYKRMSLINLSLAEMCLDADNEEFRQYEEKLTECE